MFFQFFLAVCILRVHTQPTIERDRISQNNYFYSAKRDLTFNLFVEEYFKCHGDEWIWRCAPKFFPLNVNWITSAEIFLSRNTSMVNQKQQERANLSDGKRRKISVICDSIKNKAGNVFLKDKRKASSASSPKIILTFFRLFFFSAQQNTDDDEDAHETCCC